ncbi:NAD(P)/FAD-dependent oxidoreductase [Streptomyces caniscabiei]|uniref:FAD-dependent oxidoreductase n=1 Tax=Streptomyces caniscabiei TaxID=2746961 RepID=A0ABU4N5R6_9ACTN|nr:FAD-dependent oxidoreductase [Streptomyces caniscabiei]MBE4733617.1 FAD-dependent oxidoreductase [Streptomyces caniscabiei]MBE4754794.1 FAD-dependent oxidoreductase [Streptomyces caniscabiei]MBE4768385.1 FAD-dependent oxidoreductase [Streptomyces caniscabiei]MBE4782112.1 FAD-dependent oxidoreductase [Streptomyces caniscabiei]MBE4793400.1 FAD-dependent oxidoreductase [Streptomyces caniscabiei]
MRSITVVGASLAGLSTVRALRAEGYDGEIVVVGEERHAPYDRPPLSKDFLKGEVDADALALGDPDEYDALDVHWLLGERAVRLDPAARTITLTGGRQVRTHGVVVATGASPRSLPGSDGLAGVHTLRTLDDALALRSELLTGLPRLVVIGAGFIGAEVASTAHRLGLHVTVVEAAEVPLERQLGREMGLVCSSLHTDHGVDLLCGTGVAELLGEDRVTGVRLADGRVLPADVVVVGVGVRPNTDWLAGSGVLVDDGVVCDPGCATTVPDVVAVGDVARCPHPFTGRHARVEHWSNATEQAKTAARTLLTGVPAPAPLTAPYFWSDQYRTRIQLAGYVAPGAVPEVVEGDIDSRTFTAVYRYGGDAVAVLSLNQPKFFNRLRRTLVPVAAVALS